MLTWEQLYSGACWFDADRERKIRLFRLLDRRALCLDLLMVRHEMMRMDVTGSPKRKSLDEKVQHVARWLLR